MFVGLNPDWTLNAFSELSWSLATKNTGNEPDIDVSQSFVLTKSTPAIAGFAKLSNPDVAIKHSANLFL